MNERIQELAGQCEGRTICECGEVGFNFDKFAELIIKDCIDKIETYRIPVGNSVSGELACEWTYAALKEIRDDIKEHFGVE
jgi:hypothetical protein